VPAILDGETGDLPGSCKIIFSANYTAKFCEGGYARFGLRRLKEASAPLGLLRVPGAHTANALHGRGAGRGKTAFINNQK